MSPAKTNVSLKCNFPDICLEKSAAYHGCKWLKDD